MEKIQVNINADEQLRVKFHQYIDNIFYQRRISQHTTTGNNRNLRSQLMQEFCKQNNINSITANIIKKHDIGNGS